METASGAILLVLGMIAFNNYRHGTLGQWFKAKFLNQSPADTFGGTSFAIGKAFNDAAASIAGKAAAGALGIPTGLGGPTGVMMAPVSGPITGRFGDARVGHRHEGVDFGVPVGTPVKAARAATVKYAGPASGYGLLVTLDHGGGTETRYGHLSRLQVHLGDKVSMGQTIALSGNTGESTGPHLHFEIRHGGTAVDPLPELGGYGANGTVLSA